MNVRAVLVLVLLMLVPAGSYMSDGRFRDARGNTDPDAVHVVVPDDLDALDPQVRDHLMRQIEWARDDPQDASRHATLGIAYAANARWLESRESFRMVLKLDPGEVLAKYHMAVATERLGDYDGTVELLRQIT
ncbi:MAG: hypothetical protein ACE5HE_00440, partial [Phycisphaerae bacterium]